MSILREMCDRCRAEPIEIQMRRLCRRCYNQLWHAGELQDLGPKAFCKHGHRLIGDNVYWIKASGQRTCRECRIIRKRARRAAGIARNSA